ncbi:pregnancy zone protein-like [Haliotis rubra]|uniref:pregnancy zone protein-like n=1 Tax=Haliotis rubra TaxID=36100 RepID=UPI001EE60084|nr:pregnancy zone protein-like [Haliotis rubra]
MTLWLTLLLAVTVGAVGNESSPGTYIITFAKKIAPGWTVPIRVQILNATQPVSIQIALVNRTSDTIIQSTTRSFAQGQPQTVDFQIPKDLNRPWRWNELQFNFTGTGGLKFRSSETCEFNEKSKSIFIQTDKAMYKPGQQVKFRVVAVYPDLKVVREPMDIVIYDSSKNRIKQWRGATDPSGVVSRVLAMSSDPVPGDWKIEVTLDRYKETKMFTIAEYVLPKFEVETILPSYITLNMTSVSGSVTAKYTHGKGVDGTANIHIRFSYYYGNFGSKKNPFIRKRVQVVDGKGDFDFSLDELRVLADEGDTYSMKPLLAADINLQYRSIIVEANVTETLTEKTLNAKLIRKTIYENSFKLNFIDVCPDIFKPGLTYLCGLQVSQRDDRLVSPQDLEEVNVTITYQVVLPTTPAPPTTTTTTTAKPKPKPDMVLEGNGTTGSGRPLPPITMVDPDFRRPGPGYYPRYKTVVLSSNMVNFNPKTGLAEVKANIPTDAESINLQADGFNTHAYRYASKSHSPSGSYIQLTVPDAQTRVGDNMEFQLRSTTPISDFTYQVLSRGRTVAVQDVSVPSPSSSNVFAIRMTAEMAPNPQIVVYFQHDDGEIVADAISIKVDGTFDNNVRVEFDQRSVKPGAAVNVKVHADPDSLVFLLGRDKSVLLLKDGNDITEEMVSRELMTYDYGSYFGWFDSWFRGCWLPRSSGGTDAKGVFSGANLAVVTDANVYKHRDYYYDNRFRLAVDSPMSAGGFGGAEDFGGQSNAVLEQGNFKSVERTRSNFPETWIWDMVVIGTSGHSDLSLQAPDTITTWITSAFAVNPEKGLAVATRTANLTTARKLFLRLELPYSVVRGEEFVLQATAFNYHERDLPALIILKQNAQFHNVFLSASRGQEKDIYSTQQSHSIDIPAGKGRAVYFVIKPMVVGDVILEVDLLSWESGDGVRRILRVEPEGLERTENVAMLIDLRESLTFQESTSIDFPVQMVEGSQKLRVSVAGDILGPSLTNIENLVRMPGGCGEQNMVRFAPNIYVMKYLQRTQRLTTPIKDKIEIYMEKGYQRELRYKHREGCYSTFGESATYSYGNRNCSMWLTAFVLKCFTQAYPLIPDVIDTNVLSQGLQWIVHQQDKDGSFPEEGHIFNKRMQSGTGMGVGLTAYVLIALKEAQAAQVQWPSNNDVPLDTLGGDLSRASRPDQREPASVLTDKMLLDSASKAVQYLESRLDTLNSTYDKILVAYALALAGSERASEAQSIVEAAAVRDVSSVHWKDPSPPKPTGYFHYRWYHDTEAKSIEMTSYVLLLYSLTNNVTEGLPVMRWISNQRNDRGGFMSTQDTVAALEALSKFAGDVYSPQTSINVSVNIQSYSKNFDVNPNTALLLQADDIPMANVPGVLTVTASGSGVAVLQVLKQYNENQPSINPKFELRVEVLEQTDRQFVLKTCFRHLEEGSSGMSILNIGVPTGFDPDLNERTHTAVFSRSERNENILTLYFNDISDSEGCINTVMTMVDVVIDTRPSTVTLQEYYEPDNAVSTMYSRKSTQMCSVCPQCSFRCQTRLNRSCRRHVLTMKHRYCYYQPSNLTCCLGICYEHTYTRWYGI